MGLFRLILAFIVVVAHTHPIPHLPMIGGELAVKLFFVVSGFYMALILTHHYPSSLGNFYTNRFLRLYPLFWAVLFLEIIRAVTFAWLLGQPTPWLTHLTDLVHAEGAKVVLTYVFTQFSLVGIDISHLYSWSETDGWSFYRAVGEERVLRGWNPFPMSHAWTLSCEIAFYALAPFLVRASTLRLLLFAAMITAISLMLGKVIDPGLASVANSFFAPLQFGYFILGLLSYRLYQRYSVLMEHKATAWVLAAFLVTSIFTTVWLETISYTGSRLFLWGGALCGLPALFALTRANRMDRAIGELSYPVYLVHLSMIPFVAHYFRESPAWFAASIMILSVGVSLLLNVFLGRAINRKRDAIRRRGQPQETKNRDDLQPEYETNHLSIH